MHDEPRKPTDNRSNVAGDTALQTRALENALVARRYHDWLAALAVPYLGQRPIEFGSGLGNYAEWWLQNSESGIAELTLVERDESRLERLKRRFAETPRVEVTDLDIFAASIHRRHTSMVAYNFLEHIADDAVALQAAHRLCEPGGAIVIFVPAFSFAFGNFDRLVGHYRRYTRRSLEATFAKAGLVTEATRYVNAPGLIAWFVMVRILGINPTRTPFLSAWDATVVPIARAIERRMSPPFGQSVFGVARVPRRADSPFRATRNLSD